jgi:hypothetical protein
VDDLPAPAAQGVGDGGFHLLGLVGVNRGVAVYYTLTHLKASFETVSFTS